MLPTFAELTGQRVNAGDGITLTPLLIGKGKQKEHDYLYFEFHEGGGRQAIRQGNWKLIRLNASSEAKTTWELYNIAADPSEVHNVVADYPRKVEELKVLLREAHVYDPNWPLLEVEKRNNRE